MSLLGDLLCLHFTTRVNTICQELFFWRRGLGPNWDYNKRKYREKSQFCQIPGSSSYFFLALDANGVRGDLFDQTKAPPKWTILELF